MLAVKLRALHVATSAGQSNVVYAPRAGLYSQLAEVACHPARRGVDLADQRRREEKWMPRVWPSRRPSGMLAGSQSDSECSRPRRKPSASRATDCSKAVRVRNPACRHVHINQHSAVGYLPQIRCLRFLHLPCCAPTFTPARQPSLTETRPDAHERERSARRARPNHERAGFIHPEPVIVR